ncbi:MAG: sigma-54-dependent Fis family transcriptional regulator, partial [Acidobacteria bacterium]
MVITLESPPQLSMLVIDADRQVHDTVRNALSDMPLRITAAHGREQGFELVRTQQPRLILLDPNVPSARESDLLSRIVLQDPRSEVILISEDYSPSAAVEAILKGAADYLTKPLSTHQLRARVGQVIEASRRNLQTLELDAELLSSFSFQGLVGRSPAMLEIFNRMSRIAPHFRSVLITGPSGSGKELVARSMHDLSPVRHGPFIVCNCAGIPEALAESEMFGYMKGAFTGANETRAGLFEHAHGGTIFLDEIGEMPLGIQGKLLRVLQSHEIQPIGSVTPRPLNLRVIAATNRDLRTEVSEKRFREDLFYRLSVVQLRLPSLLERKEDLPLLQKYFVEKYAKQYGKEISGISRRAQNMLSKYGWPGNIRELENAIANACMMSEGRVLDAKNFRFDPVSPTGNSAIPFISLKEMQRKHIRDVLHAVGGNKVKAAEILGISR